MKYLFIGNRRFVLEELLAFTENVDVYVIANTHLHREPMLNSIDHSVLHSKEEVNEVLTTREYDIMISNGLPYILKPSDLPEVPLVNIHPSYLPDLRGVDPVLGSILFKRDAGATCHLIDKGIDTGPLISQVKIPFSDDLHASLLYPLSFEAEKICFRDGWDRQFRPINNESMSTDGTIYFTRSSSTRLLPFTESDEEILQVVKAFDNANQGARFYIDGHECRCHDAWVSRNPFLLEHIKKYQVNTVAMVFEDTIVVRREFGALGLRHSNIFNDQDLLGKPVSGR